MSHTYLTIEERSKIEVLVQEGYKISHIANLLGHHRSTLTVSSIVVRHHPMLRKRLKLMLIN